jgi:hypothetical protein
MAIAGRHPLAARDASCPISVMLNLVQHPRNVIGGTQNGNIAPWALNQVGDYAFQGCIRTSPGEGRGPVAAGSMLAPGLRRGGQ